jgi:hypothetical protein
MLNNPLLQEPRDAYQRELKFKQTAYLSIYFVYETFLLICTICFIHALATRDAGCDKYVPYLTFFVIGNLLYICSFFLNLYLTFRHQLKLWTLKASWVFLFLGVAFKITFIVYSIVIYDRAYGDCYFPYTNQLVFMIGSFLEMIFLVFLQNFWVNNEKSLKLR